MRTRQVFTVLLGQRTEPEIPPVVRKQPVGGLYGRGARHTWDLSFLKIVPYRTIQKYHCFSPESWRPTKTSRYPAHAHGAILINTIQSRYAGLLQDRPVRAVLRLQSRKVVGLQTPPRSLCLHLRPPLLGKRRKHTDYSVILHIIRQPAPLCTAAKTVLIFPRNPHGFRIKREHSIHRRVLPYPHKSLSPRISRCGPRPFHLFTLRKKYPLRREHSRTQRNEKYQPAPHLVSQNKFGEKGTEDHEHHDVFEMQTAQRLQTSQGFKPRRQIDHQRAGKIDQSVDYDGTAHAGNHGPRWRALSSLCDARKPPEQNQRRNDAQQLIPLPALYVMKAMPFCRFVIRRRRCRRQREKEPQKSTGSC